MGGARNSGGATADWDIPTPKISHRETGGMGEAGNGSPLSAPNACSVFESESSVCMISGPEFVRAERWSPLSAPLSLMKPSFL